MTFDVTIGSIVGNTFKECRRGKDGCSKKFTTPNRPSRSGSHAGLGHYLWKIGIFNTEIPCTRPIGTSDLLAIKEIDLDTIDDPEDRDIAVWIKHWILKAYSLYGNEAAIRFS